MTKQTRNLLILFLTIFIIKASISFLMSGTYFYSDEACVVIKAKHFAETLQMLPCKDIAHAPGGDPHPLYSLIIAPFFFFFKGFTAYQAVLLFNSLAISSLVFPLYWISKNFVKKEWIAFLIITATLFLPQITIYEKMLLTESFFVFLNIWLIYFYGKYKTEKKNTRKYLLLTFLFTIMTGLERPFGFITTFAIIVNEIITAKNKKRVLLYLVPIFIIIGTFTFITLGNLWTKVLDLSFVFRNTENLKSLIVALKNQLNSLSISTLFIPILTFTALFKNKKKPQLFQKIKWYLLTLFLTNFLISANHIYGYLITDKNTDLITRYVNITIILLYFFCFIFLLTKKRFEVSKEETTIALICMVSLAFFHSQTIKHSLNLDLSPFYEKEGKNIGNLISQNKIMDLFFFPTMIFLTSLLIFGKRKILVPTFILLIFIWGNYVYYWNIAYSKNLNKNHEDKMHFRNTEKHITILQEDKYRVVNFLLWDLMTLTNNKTEIFYLDTYKGLYSKINFYNEKSKNQFKNTDYIFTNIELPLPKIKSFENTMKIFYPPQGENYEEHLEILRSENKPFIEPQDTKTLPATSNPQENDKQQS